MDVVLYKNFSVENKLNKNITEVGRYSGVQSVEPTDDNAVRVRMTAPRDQLTWSVINYFQFDGAYYFLDNVEMEASNISILVGRMDLLMTYRDAINGLMVLPERSTSHGSMRLDDQIRRISIDTDRSVLQFPNIINDNEGSGTYILTSAQPGYTR